MSDYDIESKITADISQYLEALNQVGKKTEGSWAEINQSIKNIDNQYKVWGDSVDSVAEKQKVLQGTINTLISQGMDPNDEKIQKLKASYDELGASVPQATEPIKTGLAAWGIQLDKLYDKGSGFFKQYGIDIDQLASKLGTTGPVLAGVAAIGLAVVEVGKKIAEYVQGVADAGDALMVMSGQTGISTDKLQTLQYAVEQTEGSFSAVTAAVSFMTRTLDTNGEKFEKLGIRIKNVDGSMRNAGDIFNDTLLKLSNMSDRTERNALAFDLFGRGVTGLIPTLNAGASEISRLQEQSKNLGIVMSEDLTKAGNDFNDNIATLKQSINALGFGFSEFVLKAANQFLGFWINVANALGASARAQREFTDAMEKFEKGTATSSDKLTILNSELRDLQDTQSGLNAYDEDAKKIYDDLIFQKKQQIAEQKDVLKYESEYAQYKAANDEKEMAAAEQKIKDAKRQEEITAARIKTLEEYKDALEKIDMQVEIGMITDQEAEVARGAALKTEVNGIEDIILKYDLKTGATVDSLAIASAEYTRYYGVASEAENKILDTAVESAARATESREKLSTDSERIAIETNEKIKSANAFLENSYNNSMEAQANANKTIFIDPIVQESIDATNQLIADAKAEKEARDKLYEEAVQSAATSAGRQIELDNEATAIRIKNAHAWVADYQDSEDKKAQIASDAYWRLLDNLEKERSERETANAFLISNYEKSMSAMSNANKTIFIDPIVQASIDMTNKLIADQKRLPQDIATVFSGVSTIIKDLTYDMDDMSKAGVDAGVNIGKSFLNVIISGGSVVSIIGLIVTLIDELVKGTNRQKEAEKAWIETQKIAHESKLEYSQLWTNKLKEATATELEIIQMKWDAELEIARKMGTSIDEVNAYYHHLYVEEEQKEATDSATIQKEAADKAIEIQKKAAEEIIAIKQKINDYNKTWSDKLARDSATDLELLFMDWNAELERAKAIGGDIDTVNAYYNRQYLKLLNEKEQSEIETTSKQIKEGQRLANEQAKSAMEATREIEEYNKKWQDTQKTKLELIDEEREAELKKANDIGASQETLLAIQSYYATEYKKEVDNLAKAEQKAIDDQAKAAQEAADVIQRASEAAAKASYDYARSVIDVGQEIINGINEGLNEADFTSAIMKKLQQAAIEAAILSAGLGEAMALIGKEIADAMIGGLTGEEVSKIKSDIASLYNQAQGIAGQIGQLFPQAAEAVGQIGNIEQSLYPTGLVFNTPGGMNSGFTSGGQKGSNYFTFYSPTAIDAAEAARLMNKTTRDMAFQGVIS